MKRLGRWAFHASTLSPICRPRTDAQDFEENQGAGFSPLQLLHACLAMYDADIEPGTGCSIQQLFSVTRNNPFGDPRTSAKMTPDHHIKYNDRC